VDGGDAAGVEQDPLGEGSLAGLWRGQGGLASLLDDGEKAPELGRGRHLLADIARDCVDNYFGLNVSLTSMWAEIPTFLSLVRRALSLSVHSHRARRPLQHETQPLKCVISHQGELIALYAAVHVLRRSASVHHLAPLGHRQLRRPPEPRQPSRKHAPKPVAVNLARS